MKTIASALVKAQKSFAPALKTSTNPHFRSKYVDLAGCVEAVIDALNERIRRADQRRETPCTGLQAGRTGVWVSTDLF